MLLGESGRYLRPCRRPGFSAPPAGPAEFEIERLIGFERGEPVESAAPQHRRFQRQLRRKSHLDFVSAWRRSALVIDEPRSARSEFVDSVGPRGQFERRAARERKDDFAPPLDPNALDIAARLALEVEDEVEALFDVGPVQGGKRRIGAEQGEPRACDGKERFARLGREGAGGVFLARIPAARRAMIRPSRAARARARPDQAP